jgi:hypothetical protein
MAYHTDDRSGGDQQQYFCVKAYFSDAEIWLVGVLFTKDGTIRL